MMLEYNLLVARDQIIPWFEYPVRSFCLEYI